MRRTLWKTLLFSLCLKVCGNGTPKVCFFPGLCAGVSLVYSRDFPILWFGFGGGGGFFSFFHIWGWGVKIPQYCFICWEVSGGVHEVQVALCSGSHSWRCSGNLKWYQGGLNSGWQLARQALWPQDCLSDPYILESLKLRHPIMNEYLCVKTFELLRNHS